MKTIEAYDEEFARLYDLLIYGREEVEADETGLRFLRWVFQNICLREVHEIPDIGCGTGRYLIPLIREGYQVTGLDNSMGMLDECRRRLGHQKLTAEWVHEDFEDLDATAEFDALLCMNSVICYVLETDHLRQVLRRFRQALRPGGILVIDNWNFLAQSKRWGKTYSDVRGNENIRIEYQDYHGYDAFSSIYRMEITAHISEGEKRLHIHRKEALRVMTAGEMESYLREMGFSQVLVRPGYDSLKEIRTDGERMIFMALSPATSIIT